MSTATEVREIALSLPDTEEVETWGHPTFRVGGHIFIGLNDTAESAGATANVKATLDTQAALVGKRPDTFSVSPRVGKSGWITVVVANIDAGELRELISDARHLVAQRRHLPQAD